VSNSRPSRRTPTGTRRPGLRSGPSSCSCRPSCSSRPKGRTRTRGSLRRTIRCPAAGRPSTPRAAVRRSSRRPRCRSSRWQQSMGGVVGGAVVAHRDTAARRGAGDGVERRPGALGGSTGAASSGSAIPAGLHCPPARLRVRACCSPANPDRLATAGRRAGERAEVRGPRHGRAWACDAFHLPSRSEYIHPP
jgi:hypothetical protein